MSNAPRAWTSIAGQSPGGAARLIVGEETLRTVYYDPTFARVEVDTTVTPPRVTVTSSAAIAGQADLTALTARVAALEAIILGRIERTNTGLRFVDSVGDPLVEYGITDGNAKGIGFYGTSINPRPVVSESSMTLDTDMATALNGNGTLRKDA